MGASPGDARRVLCGLMVNLKLSKKELTDRFVKFYGKEGMSKAPAAMFDKWLKTPAVPTPDNQAPLIQFAKKQLTEGNVQLEGCFTSATSLNQLASLFPEPPLPEPPQANTPPQANLPPFPNIYDELRISERCLSERISKYSGTWVCVRPSTKNQLSLEILHILNNNGQGIGRAIIYNDEGNIYRGHFIISHQNMCGTFVREVDTYINVRQIAVHVPPSDNSPIIGGYQQGPVDYNEIEIASTPFLLLRLDRKGALSFEDAIQKIEKMRGKPGRWNANDHPISRFFIDTPELKGFPKDKFVAPLMPDCSKINRYLADKLPNPSDDLAKEILAAVAIKKTSSGKPRKPRAPIAETDGAE